MEKLVKQMKGIVDSARSQSKAEREAAQKQLKELVTQVQRLVDDASYKGLNLINSDTSKLSVRFSEKSDSKLDVNGVDLNGPKFFRKGAGGVANVSAAAVAQAIVTSLGFSKALSAYDLSKAADPHAIALWNSTYIQAALDHLAHEGWDTSRRDTARISPLAFKHINFVGRYAYPRPEAVAEGALRPLRNPNFRIGLSHSLMTVHRPVQTHGPHTRCSATSRSYVMIVLRPGYETSGCGGHAA